MLDRPRHLLVAHEVNRYEAMASPDDNLWAGLHSDYEPSAAVAEARARREDAQRRWREVSEGGPQRRALAIGFCQTVTTDFQQDAFHRALRDTPGARDALRGVLDAQNALRKAEAAERALREAQAVDLEWREALASLENGPQTTLHEDDKYGLPLAAAITQQVIDRSYTDRLEVAWRAWREKGKPTGPNTGTGAPPHSWAELQRLMSARRDAQTKGLLESLRAGRDEARLCTDLKVGYPEKPLPARVWNYLEIVWKASGPRVIDAQKRASGQKPDGPWLHVRVRPASTATEAEARVRINTEAACRAWLLKELADGRDQAKDAWEAEAKGREGGWPNISHEGWLRVWATATDKFPIIKKAGRKRTINQRG
jgi:hypothetical protein